MKVKFLKFGIVMLVFLLGIGLALATFSNYITVTGSVTVITTTTTSTTTTVPQLANIVINEIMYNPQGSDTDNEWIEIYNKDDFDHDISCWKLFESDTNHGLTFDGNTIIPAESYAVIADDAENFLDSHPDYNGTLIDSSFSLINTGEYIALKDCSLNIIDGVTYSNSWGGDNNGKTIEKNIDGWSESLIDGGTPGYENSIVTSTTTVV